jgi:four helix bundle protein
MGDFKQLVVWQRGHALSLAVYAATRRFPEAERYGVIAQLRRTAASVANNIAEGTGRQGDTEFARFLQIARGSASELESQLLLSRDLGYITPDVWRSLDQATKEVSRMLNRLIRSLRARDPQPDRPRQ